MGTENNSASYVTNEDEDGDEDEHNPYFKEAMDDYKRKMSGEPLTIKKWFEKEGKEWPGDRTDFLQYFLESKFGKIQERELNLFKWAIYCNAIDIQFAIDRIGYLAGKIQDLSPSQDYRSTFKPTEDKKLNNEVRDVMKEFYNNCWEHCVNNLNQTSIPNDIAAQERRKWWRETCSFQEIQEMFTTSVKQVNTGMQNNSWQKKNNENKNKNKLLKVLRETNLGSVTGVLPKYFRITTNAGKNYSNEDYSCYPIFNHHKTIQLQDIREWFNMQRTVLSRYTRLVWLACLSEEKFPNKSWNTFLEQDQNSKNQNNKRVRSCDTRSPTCGNNGYHQSLLTFEQWLCFFQPIQPMNFTTIEESEIYKNLSNQRNKEIKEFKDKEQGYLDTIKKLQEELQSIKKVKQIDDKLNEDDIEAKHKAYQEMWATLNLF